MVRNEYPHFNPVKHKLDVKVAVVRSSFHCKHNINYHIIWIPKFRKKLLTGKVAEVLRTIIEGQCREMQCEKLALEIMPDHGNGNATSLNFLEKVNPKVAIISTGKDGQTRIPPSPDVISRLKSKDIQIYRTDKDR